MAKEFDLNYEELTILTVALNRYEKWLNKELQDNRHDMGMQHDYMEVGNLMQKLLTRISEKTRGDNES